MKDYINIKRTTFPCSYDVILGVELFNLSFKYNNSADLFTCTLSKGGNVLVYDEPVIYGKPLFNDVYIAGVFPAVNIVPLDESGQSETITYDNFLKSVRLTIDNGGEA